MQNKSSSTPTPLFRRDFTLVVVGQIVSLFGNAVLRYALPLYLLNQTHSAALFGVVSACSFLPGLLLAPVGGLVADRVNKRNVMVALDFSTAALVLGCALLLGRAPLVPLLVAVLMALYGIQGAYQPAVQAALPVLAAPQQLGAANAVINMVSSLAGLVGPVLGGVVYAAVGIVPILRLSIGCFVASAVMELFIRIPFAKRPAAGSVWATARQDMADALRFLRAENPQIAKAALLLAGVNLVFSALIVVGVPVVVTEFLGFDAATGSRLYGYAQGALAVGGLLGGAAAGVLGQRVKIQQADRLLWPAAATLAPMALALALAAPWPCYAVLVVCCTTMMVFATVLNIVLIAYIQHVTPGALVGKVMALLTCLVMAAHPIGQALYGLLFERFGAVPQYIFAGALLACLLLCAVARRVMGVLPEPRHGGGE